MSSTASGPSAIKQQIGNSATLLDALDAASKWPAFLLLSSTFFLSVISVALFGAVTVYLGSKSTGLGAVMGVISTLIVAGIAMVGINATGILLGDEVWGRRQRGIVDAVLASVFSCHRLIAVLAIEFLLFLLFLLALTFIIFVCKIPGLGPVLYAVVMPLGVISTGLVYFALAYIAVPLAAPAIWNGSSVKSTLLMLQAVARKRLLTTVVMMVLLGLLAALVIGFVWGILALGAITVFSLSGILLDVQGGGLGSIMQMFGGGGGSGYAYALGFGATVLMLVGANPGMLIALKGTSIIYREVSEGLSLEADEAQLNRRMQDIKARAEQARQQPSATVQQHSAMAAPAAAPVAAAVAGAACPACHGQVTSDDVFCGNCGHKLK